MRTRVLSATLLSLLVALPAAAGTLAGVTLPDKVDVAGQTLVLNGMGLRSKFIIKVYVGGLYLPQKEKSGAKILSGDEARRMTLHFIYDVSKEQMCEAWEEGLEKNSPNAGPEVKKGFTTLCAWMDGVGKGTELVLTYLPGEGTHVEVGGKEKGTLPGKPTADAILATWIGANPAPGKDFKRAVLSG
jgi:hypothetical protein